MLRISLCRRCGEPLVSTMMFSKAELYCVNCGQQYGLFGAWGVPETEKLHEKLTRLRAEFDALSRGAIADGGMKLNDCESCRTLHEPHLYHASSEELLADVQARNRLRDRAAQAVT